jgi:hypothetical protein
VSEVVVSQPQVENQLVRHAPVVLAEDTDGRAALRGDRAAAILRPETTIRQEKRPAEVKCRRVRLPECLPVSVVHLARTSENREMISKEQVDDGVSI